MVTSFADGTKISFEQAIVANATGMSVSARGMRGARSSRPRRRTDQSYDIEIWRPCGGVVDYVVGAKPGPGVFVLATHDDPKQQHYLESLQARQRPALQLLHAVPPLPLRGADHRRLAPYSSATPRSSR